MTHEEQRVWLIKQLQKEKSELSAYEIPEDEQEQKNLLRAQGHEEPTGHAKITPGYNLPCKYVLHTVGPIVQGKLQRKHEELLASCYRSCLELAEEYEVKSIAFCCISTGVFMFPNERAAEIAVDTVRKYLEETGSRMKMVFNVFKQEDYEIYSRILGKEID